MKSSILTIATALLCAVSCSIEPIKPEIESPKAVVTFSATAPVPESKIAMDGEGKTTWIAEKDTIMLYYLGGSCKAVANESGAATTFTTLEAIPTDKPVYCAVYPSSRLASFDGSNVTVDFTQGNEPALLAYSAICTAKTITSGGDLHFHNVAAMMKFTTTSNKIHEARFYSETGNTFTIVGSNTDTRVPYKVGTYYVPVPAGESSTGFSLRLKKYDGEDYPALYRPANRAFEVSHIYNVGTIESKVFNPAAEGPTSFRLMSFNILRADLGGEGNQWTDRKDACLAMLEANAPDLLGLQECTSNQRNDILRAFPKYGAVGISVKGQSASAYETVSSNPILYDGAKFTLEQWGTYWLTAEPTRTYTADNPNNTWYYRKPRTATWARFKVNGRDLHFVFVCLHLQDDKSTGDNSDDIDYDGTKAQAGADCRAKEIAVVTDRLATINPDGYPMIIGGDFNSTGTEDYYSTLRSGFSLARLDASIKDTGRTSNGFSQEGGSTIDNIFYGGFNASVFAVDRSAYEGRTYISDHYPVFADFSFPTTSMALDGWEETDL